MPYLVFQYGTFPGFLIVLYQLLEAEKKQIQFKVDFAYPPNLLIDIYDIAVILNNALENAIEACRKAEGNKQIKLHSYVKGSLFFIEVENDFSEDIIIEKELGFPVWHVSRFPHCTVPTSETI